MPKDHLEKLLKKAKCLDKQPKIQNIVNKYYKMIENIDLDAMEKELDEILFSDQ